MLPIQVAWNPVVHGINIPFDLESTPLQIKTDSTTVSDEWIQMITYTAAGSLVGLVWVRFTSPIQYSITYCTTGWTNLPVQPPDEVDKIWTIRKTATTFIIECNAVEVLNHQFSDSAIRCTSSISQHHFYPSVCPGFTVDGSLQETWDDTDPGQTVTINCQKKHVRDGSSERTCIADAMWNNDPPLCRKQSK
eukprot:sb/3471060/